MCYVDGDVTNDGAIVSKVLGQEGGHLQAWHALYSFCDHHLRARARSFDTIQSLGLSLLVFERFALVCVALKFAEDLTAFDKQANEAGTMFDNASIYVWPRLLSDRLMRVLGVWSLTWQNVAAKVEAMPMNKFQWTYDKGEGDVVKNIASESTLLNLQLLMLVRLPSAVQKSAVADTLPLVEDGRFADCIFESVGFGQQPFVLAARAAQYLESTHDAVRYLRAALVRHANPLKQHYAHCLLGGLQS
jgi:hypothetical protein